MRSSVSLAATLLCLGATSCKLGSDDRDTQRCVPLDHHVRQPDWDILIKVHSDCTGRLAVTGCDWERVATINAVTSSSGAYVLQIVKGISDPVQSIAVLPEKWQATFTLMDGTTYAHVQLHPGSGVDWARLCPDRHSP